MEKFHYTPIVRLELGLKPFVDCPDYCENFHNCWNTEGCLERLEEEKKDEAREIKT